MATRYVATTGDDTTGTGAIGAPWKTLTKAESGSTAGDTVIVADGTYDETQLLSSKQLNWQGTSQAGTILAFTGGSRLLRLTGSAVRTFNNFTLQSNVAGSGPTHLLETIAGQPDANTTFTNCTFSNGRNSCINLGAGAGNITLEDCTVNITLNTCAQFITVAGNTSFYIWDTTINYTSTSSNGLFVQTSAASGAKFEVDGCTITMATNFQIFKFLSGGYDGLEITNNVMNLPATCTRSIIQLTDHLNEVITGNTITVPVPPATSTASIPIVLKSTTGTASVANVSSNIIKTYNNENYGIIIGDDGPIASVPGAYDGSTISFNQLYTGGYYGYGAGSMHGIMCGYNKIHVRNNKVYGSAYGVVCKNNGADWGTSGSVFNNEFYNCGGMSVFRIKGSAGVRIYNNRIIQNDGDNNTVFSITNNGVTELSQNCIIYNNIVDIDSGTAFAFDDTSYVGTTCDYNYYGLSGSAIMGDYNAAGNDYATLATWKAGTGLDKNSGVYIPKNKLETPKKEADNILFRETYDNVVYTKDNDGTPYGNPLIRGNGLELDGVSGIDYDTTMFYESKKTVTNQLSIKVVFTPTFEYTANNYYTFLSADPIRLFKMNNADSNIIRFIIGGNNIDIPSAAYSPYWKTGQENTLIIASLGTAPASTDAYLNGTQVLTADNTAWAMTEGSYLSIGAIIYSIGAIAYGFTGKIHDVTIYGEKISV